MTPVKTPIKTIEVRSDGIYASHLEKPIASPELSNFSSHDEVMKFREYQNRLSAYTSSLIKVENPEVIRLWIPRMLPIQTQSDPIIYQAIDGLVMEIVGKNHLGFLSCCRTNDCYCGEKLCLVSFLPDKEEEKEIKDYFAWLTPEKAERLTRPVNWNKPKSELKEDVVHSYSRPVEGGEIGTEVGFKEDVGEEKGNTKLDEIRARIPQSVKDQVDDTFDAIEQAYELGKRDALLSPQEKPEKEKKTEFDRLIEKRMQEEIDKPKFNLFPAWSEDEYILASNLWKIFKSNAGTSGKKMAIEEIRKFIMNL